MDGLALLLGVRRNIIWNIIRTIGEHSRLKLISILVLGGGIWISLFIFPLLGFTWVVRILRETTVSDMLVSLFFFLLTLMLIFSNAVIAYTGLFRSGETSFLQTAPVRPGTLFLYKMSESLAFSSWAFLLLGLPIMLAFGIHKNAPWFYYPSIIFFFAGFILIPAALGATAAMLISTALILRTRRFLTWIAVAVGVLSLILLVKHINSEGQGAGIFIATSLIERVSFTHSVFLPSSWISRGLAICSGSPGPEGLGHAVYYLGLLVSNSLFFCLVAYFISDLNYRRAWDAVHSTGGRVRFKRLSMRLDEIGPNSRLYHLVLKDLKTFIRDPVQWTQCAVLFGLLALYILNLRNLRYPVSQIFWRNLTSLLNLGSICLVLATLTTRFVFPMFSLEGQRSWVVGMMPMSRRLLLWSKLVFSLVASLAITLALMILSDIMLAEPPGVILVHVTTVALISIGLSGMAVGLSALYPSFREASPAKIVSGFGGTLNLILSLLFVSLVVSMEALPVYLWSVSAITREQMVVGTAGALALIAALAAAAFGVPMYLGTKALNRMEF